MKRVLAAVYIFILFFGLLFLPRMAITLFAQNTQTRTPIYINLQPTQVSGIAATTLTRNTVVGLNACKALDILLNITAGGTATGTLTIFIEDSADGGTTWDDVISSNTFALGAAVITQRFFVNGYVASSATQGSAAAAETLAAGTVRSGPFADRFRIREKITGPAGSPVGATYIITAVCKQ